MEPPNPAMLTRRYRFGAAVESRDLAIGQVIDSQLVIGFVAVQIDRADHNCRVKRDQSVSSPPWTVVGPKSAKRSMVSLPGPPSTVVVPA